MRKLGKWILAGSVVLCSMFLTAGCNGTDVLSMSTQENESGQITAKKEEGQAVGEIQLKGSMDGNTYRSENGKFEITLPDDTWTCTGDSQNYSEFTSGESRITEVYMEGSEVAQASDFKSEDDYVMYLRGTNPDLSGVVEEFTAIEKDGKKICSAVYHYSTDTESGYYITQGVIEGNSCYIINGIVPADDEASMLEVKTSIFGSKI